MTTLSNAWVFKIKNKRLGSAATRRTREIRLFVSRKRDSFLERPIGFSAPSPLGPDCVPVRHGRFTCFARIFADGQYVDSVLEIRLLVVSGAQCNTTYYTSNRKQLKFGILDDRMMCAVSSDGKTDTCGVRNHLAHPPLSERCKGGLTADLSFFFFRFSPQGDSGGSLVAADVDRPGVYTQYGITSFGKYCGDKNIPGVYTKVSHYIRWIETIVWPSG